MGIFRKIRRYIYRKSELLQYLWLKHIWHKLKKEAENLSDRELAQKYYYDKVGKTLNLDNPKTFDEKLWYLKLNYRNPLLTVCSDKLKVREYVKNCGLEHILNDLYGVWDDARKIDFDKIESPCFFKCNHTSGDNIIFDREKKFNKKLFIRHFNFMLKQNYYWGGREWNYKNIEPRIIGERVLRTSDGELPIDYKFFCFGGEAKLVFINVGTATEEGKHSKEDEWGVFDTELNPIDMVVRIPSKISRKIEKPINWEKMIQYAEILSEPFPHCRVDLYNIEGEIFFGEITFYHCGGCTDIKPTEWNMRLGSWINISEIKKIN